MERLSLEDLNGKCLYFEKIKGRVADLTTENGKIQVRSYNRFECPLPNGKPQEEFEPDAFWEWLEQANFKVIPSIQYSPI